MVKEYVRYVQDNPQKYWFKRKLYGWGWTPATWQGWIVLAAGIAIAFAGAYVAEAHDAPGAAIAGLVLMIAFILVFCFWKGEKPRWQWGPDGK